MTYEEFYTAHVELFKSGGAQAYGRCPFHPDKVRSFSVNLESSLWTCHAGCGNGNATTFAKQLGVMPPDEKGEFFRGHSSPRPAPRPAPKPVAKDTRPRRIVESYEYEYEDGAVAFRVVRTDPKGFFQQRPDGKGGWIPGTTGVRRIPYRLPAILNTVPPGLIYLVEGEKDVHRLERHGLTATTTPMGAGNWDAEYANYFSGRRVVIIPDNDEPGESFADRAAEDIFAVGGQVKIVKLPGIEIKGDVSDFLQIEGNTIDTLLTLVRNAPLFGKIRIRNIDPYVYLTENGFHVSDGKASLPHEFRKLCDEAIGELMRKAKHMNDEVEKRLNEANALHKNCRTRGTYQRYLRLIKEAHECSMVKLS